MLNEIRNVRQVPGDPARRWFTDEFFDLIVWLDRAGAVTGFQLCYDKQGDERAITWRSESGWSHERVDTGEVTGRMKMTPILVQDGIFDHATIAARFRGEARRIDQPIADFVYQRLLEYR
jgi:hypothetical protein